MQKCDWSRELLSQQMFQGLQICDPENPCCGDLACSKCAYNITRYKNPLECGKKLAECDPDDENSCCDDLQCKNIPGQGNFCASGCSKDQEVCDAKNPCCGDLSCVKNKIDGVSYCKMPQCSKEMEECDDTDPCCEGLQ